MNSQIKTVALTIAALSLFVIALVELSGVSSTALFNKYHIGSGDGHLPHEDARSRSQQAAAMPKTTIEFDETMHTFGTIKEGEDVAHNFRFRNTGASPLLIVNAEASCGCTVPNWPKEPIPPGGEGVIEVAFHSKGRKGHQKKNVLITSNAQTEHISIGFEAEVVD